MRRWAPRRPGPRRLAVQMGFGAAAFAVGNMWRQGPAPLLFVAAGLTLALFFFALYDDDPRTP